MRDEAVAALTVAFMDDPEYRELLPDRAVRERCLETLWRAALRYVHRYGEGFTTVSVEGVALWLAPGGTTTTAWRSLRAGLPLAIIKLPRRALRHFLAVMTHLDRLHKELVPEPHWYLWALGVRPEHQGHGIGTRLIEPVLARARAEQLPVYLEAIAESNVVFYERRGFEVVRAGKVPGEGLKYWAMIKRPDIKQTSAQP